MNRGKILLSEPQERLLLSLFDHAGIRSIDGNERRPLDALVGADLAVYHGAVAAKLTVAGEAEAFRRKIGG